MHHFADDNPDFLRFDKYEGSFKVISQGALHIDQDAAQRLSGGAIKGAGINVASGGKIILENRFPNCYIFCLGQVDVPTIKMAREIHHTYDDWYLVTNLVQFIKRTSALLLNQLTLADIEGGEKMNMEWLRGLNLSIVHRACSYDERELVFSQGLIHQAIQATEDPLEWAFIKEVSHSAVPEYRILFILQDEYGAIVPVKKDIKILKLVPALGVSLANVLEGGEQ
jgi:hypothetical protein